MAGESKTTRDHETIRRWAEERDGTPTIVKGTGESGPGAGLLRIDFPGYEGEDTLEEVSWDKFFETFDKSDLEFLYQEKTKDGSMSRFFKFIDAGDQ